MAVGGDDKRGKGVKTGGRRGGVEVGIGGVYCRQKGGSVPSFVGRREKRLGMETREKRGGGRRGGGKEFGDMPRKRTVAKAGNQTSFKQCGLAGTQAVLAAWEEVLTSAQPCFCTEAQ